MTRLGVVLPWIPTVTPREYIDLAREVEARGYHTTWLGEVTGADAFALMTLVLGHTERLRAATGVVPVQTRTPVVLAMTASTLGHVAPGRFSLGLGVSSRAIVEQWNGLRFETGVGQIREAVQILRAAMAGERVNFEGTYYRIRNLRMSTPPPVPPVPIILGALGPRMLELAGEIADGVLLNWCAPESVPALLRHVEAGARRAGRSLDGFEVAAFIRTAVTEAPEPAREVLARDITGYAIVDAYASYFRASGFAPEMEAVNRAWGAGDRTGAVKQISPRLLDALGVVGSPAFCRARIEEYVRAGLTMPVVVPFAPEGERRASVLGTIRSFP